MVLNALDIHAISVTLLLHLFGLYTKGGQKKSGDPEKLWLT